MNYSVNTALKREIREYGITYADIAVKSNYSVASIKKFFGKPMTGCQERIVRKAVKEIKDGWENH